MTYGKNTLQVDGPVQEATAEAQVPKFIPVGEVAPEHVARVTSATISFDKSGYRRISYKSGLWINCREGIGIESLMFDGGRGSMSLTGTVVYTDEEAGEVTFVNPERSEGYNHGYTWATLSRDNGLEIRVKEGLQLDYPSDAPGDRPFHNAAYQAKRQGGH